MIHADATFQICWLFGASELRRETRAMDELLPNDWFGHITYWLLHKWQWENC